MVQLAHMSRRMSCLLTSYSCLLLFGIVSTLVQLHFLVSVSFFLHVRVVKGLLHGLPHFRCYEESDKYCNLSSEHYAFHHWLILASDINRMKLRLLANAVTDTTCHPSFCRCTIYKLVCFSSELRQAHVHNYAF